MFVNSLCYMMVSVLDLDGGVLDEETGIVSWSFALDAGEQKELILKYDVKYPKRESLVLE